ncbi:hypothetical protein [Variovorax brevis]|uniref:hypothetical protein n=1 Tax=Variovorax brevis TaxID=3053503 RepID=UPI004037F120
MKAQLKRLAQGITPAEVIAKFKTMQMVDVHVPTTDGRELVLSRYTQPEADHRMLLDLLRLKCPINLRRRSPPNNAASLPNPSPCSGDLQPRAQSNQALSPLYISQLRKMG